MSICSKCGAELKPGKKFCINCGAKVTEAEAKAPESPLEQGETSLPNPVPLLKQENKKSSEGYNTLNAQKNELTIQLNTLKQEKQDLCDKVTELEKKNQKSSEAYKTALRLLQHSVTELEKKNQKSSEAYKTLSKQRNDLATVFNILIKEKQDLCKQITSLKQEKQDLSNQVASLKQETQNPFDAVMEFNKWASNPREKLPSQFYYLKNEMRIRMSVAALEESTNENSKWITNREGTKKYLFPNPNSFTPLTDITGLYDMDLNQLREKGQNKVKITKPCEMEPNGFIWGKGELQLLSVPTPSYREHTVASGASLYNKRESDKPERSIPTPSYRQPPAEGTDSPSSSLYNRRASDKPESGASASYYRQAPTASVISSKTAEPEVNYIRSSFYSSEEQRNKRKDEGQDQFLDVNTDSYQRMLQGENVPLSFEKYGNWSTATYLLTENNELFLNFHRFNDSKPPVPQDLTKTLNALFEVRGNLPGKVKRCVPAQMTLKGSDYFVARKGVLELGA